MVAAVRYSLACGRHSNGARRAASRPPSPVVAPGQRCRTSRSAQIHSTCRTRPPRRLTSVRARRQAPARGAQSAGPARRRGRRGGWRRTPRRRRAARRRARRGGPPPWPPARPPTRRPCGRRKARVRDAAPRRAPPDRRRGRRRAPRGRRAARRRRRASRRRRGGARRGGGRGGVGGGGRTQTRAGGRARRRGWKRTRRRADAHAAAVCRGNDGRGAVDEGEHKAAGGGVLGHAAGACGLEQVHAGAEGGAGTGEDDDARGRGGRAVARECLGERGVERGVEGVARGRAVEGEERDLRRREGGGEDRGGACLLAFDGHLGGRAGGTERGPGVRSGRSGPQCMHSGGDVRRAGHPSGHGRGRPPQSAVN
jgi:hypothetical protein